MTSIDSGQRISLSQLKLLAPPKATPATDEMKQRIEEGWKAQFTRPVGPPDNAPQNLYAEVYKNGKVISQIYNGGAASTPNALSNVIMGDPALRDCDPGPQLAQKRAEAIAKASGGTVVKAKTAQTQAQWEARPPREFYFDEAAYTAERARHQEAARANHEQALAALPQLKLIAQEQGWDWTEFAGSLLSESEAGPAQTQYQTR